MGARVGLRQGRIQKKRSEGGKHASLPKPICLPYTYHVKDGQFGGGGGVAGKNVFLSSLIKFLPSPPPFPLDPPMVCVSFGCDATYDWKRPDF